MTSLDHARPALARQDLLDLAAVESAAHEALRQCEFLRLNGGTDVIRWGFIAERAWDAWRVAAKADRRHAKVNEWWQVIWTLPRGYDRV